MILTAIILLIILLYFIIGTIIVCLLADTLNVVDLDENTILYAVPIWPILSIWWIYKSIIYLLVKLYEHYIPWKKH